MVSNLKNNIYLYKQLNYFNYQLFILNIKFKIIKTLISWVDTSNFLDILIDDLKIDETNVYKLGISCHIKMIIEFCKKEIKEINSELSFTVN